MKLYKILYSVLIVLFTTILFQSQLFSQITPFDVLPHIMRGINLGNTFETDSVEGHWKQDAPEEWKDNGPAQEYYFDAYKQAGFTCVRIPVTWHTRTLYESPYTIDNNWLQRVDEVVEWALERNLFVILNAHHETWLKENYSNAQYRERFDSIWSQVSMYFKDKPERLMFEIINEPLGMSVSEVDDVNARILQIIRKSNPTRIVLFSGNKWSNVDELRLAAIPQDNYIMGYYHSYEPWSFAGEGQGTWGTPSDIAAMKARIAKGKDWVEKNNIPLIISEFGTDTLCDYNSRMLFYAYYVEEAFKQNIAFAVWDDGGTFNVYRRNQQTWHDTKEILIHYSHVSPTQLELTQQDNSVKIHWLNRMTADSVDIERRFTNSHFQTIARVANTDELYVDTDIIPEDFYYYRIKAYRNDSIFYSYSQRILVAPNESQRNPYFSEPFVIPTSFQAEHFDKGGYGLTYYDVDFIQSHSNYRSEKGVDIIQTQNQSYALIQNQKGEWYEYSVNVPIAAEYEISVYIGAITSGSFSIQSNGVIKSKSFTATGSYTNVIPNSIRMQLQSGNQILRLNITKTGDFAIDSIAITGINSSLNTLENTDFRIIKHENNRFTVVSVNYSSHRQPISIYNVLGKQILQLQLEHGLCTFSLMHMPHGLYLVKCGGIIRAIVVE